MGKRSHWTYFLRAWLGITVMVSGGCGSEERPKSMGGDVFGTGGSATGGTGGSATGGTGGEAGVAGEGTCESCHGSEDNPAPPLDLLGNKDPSKPSVGAHQAHLRAGAWSKAVDCEQCHVVPTQVQDPEVPSHRNGVTDIHWGSLAQAGTYDPSSRSCSGTYCHGAMLGEDRVGVVSNRKPTWTIVNGSQTVCGTSCHTLPPGGDHLPATDCSICHGSVIESVTPGEPFMVSWKDASLHIDGAVDAQMSSRCTDCHGDPATGRISPPRGTQGETQTFQPAVGAHEIHLDSSTWHRKGRCTDCHQMPTSSSHPDGKVDLGWGGPSGMDGASPSYDGAARVCSNTYCHGATLAGPNAGGSVSREPVWTDVSGVGAPCGTRCHTLPPGGTHPDSTVCQACHKSTIYTIDMADPWSAVWTNPGQHINGRVDF